MRVGCSKRRRPQDVARTTRPRGRREKSEATAWTTESLLHTAPHGMGTRRRHSGASARCQQRELRGQHEERKATLKVKDALFHHTFER